MHNMSGTSPLAKLPTSSMGYGSLCKGWWEQTESNIIVATAHRSGLLDMKPKRCRICLVALDTISSHSTQNLCRRLVQVHKRLPTHSTDYVDVEPLKRTCIRKALVQKPHISTKESYSSQERVLHNSRHCKNTTHQKDFRRCNDRSYQNHPTKTVGDTKRVCKRVATNRKWANRSTRNGNICIHLDAGS